MRVKEPDCLVCTTASPTTDRGTTGLLEFTFASVNSLRVKLDIIKAHLYTGQRYLAWILKTYPTTQTLPSLSATLSPEDGEVVFPALILERIN